MRLRTSVSSNTTYIMNEASLLNEKTVYLESNRELVYLDTSLCLRDECNVIVPRIDTSHSIHPEESIFNFKIGIIACSPDHLKSSW